MIKIFLFSILFILSNATAHANQQLCDIVLLGFDEIKTLGLRDEPLEIYTERLVLRTAQEADLEYVLKMMEDPDIKRFYFTRPLSTPDAELYFQNNLRQGLRENSVLNFKRFNFIIQTKLENKVIGIGHVTQYADDMWEIGGAIDPAFRHQGYFRERTIGLIEFIRKINPKAIIHGRVLKQNIASQVNLKNWALFCNLD